ncbi:MAG: penicillin-binding transpeptidase domain-containing protein, partial [Patescibacteria group bacterium]
GDLALTPIQVNLMTSVIAWGGKLCPPHLKEGRPQVCKDLNIESQNLELIKKGMEGACETGGTAFPFFGLNASLPAGRQVACKTGTAETDELGSTHAWITLFAPADFPEIVLTVLVEKGGEGSYIAAPIAKEILESWQKLRY